jgi:hypothetical protein
MLYFSAAFAGVSSVVGFSSGKYKSPVLPQAEIISTMMKGMNKRIDSQTRFCIKDGIIAIFCCEANPVTHL